MLGWFEKEWDLAHVAPPWGDRPSIYEHIRAHVTPTRPGLTAGGDSLPDDEKVWSKSRVRWVAGGLDGALGAHGGPGEKRNAAASVFGSLKRATRVASVTNLQRLYDSVATNATIDYVDPFLELLVNDATLQTGRVHQFAKWFAQTAPDREVVKWALATLGVVSRDEVDLLVTFGRHEEFTLYAVVAVKNSASHPGRVMWELARQVKGWGRIHAIEHLAGTEDSEIKRWMLREGYDNSIMLEYTALTCATSGGLLEALSEEAVDDELLKGAGEIIDALIAGDGGPATGISDYTDGATTVDAYLGHVLRRQGTLEQFLVVDGIRRMCTDTERDWSVLAGYGWTPERREEIHRQAERFLDREHWKTVATTGLESPDTSVFETAVRAARTLGIDTWDHQFRRLLAGEDRWYWVMQTDDDERVERAIALALERIPLTEIATGPGDELGLGPAFRHHSQLDFIVQDLKRFPGKGLALVHTALRSPVIRNRNMALNALAAWGEWRWGPDTRPLLEAALKDEPVDDVRERIGKVLAGQSF